MSRTHVAPRLRQAAFCEKRDCSNMSSSYYRNCRKCGRRIQLRQMPGKQWVAYEGYDTIHNCSVAPKRERRRQPGHSHTGPGYEDIEFSDIDVTDGNRPVQDSSVVKRRMVGVDDARPKVRSTVCAAIAQNRVLRIEFSDHR